MDIYRKYIDEKVDIDQLSDSELGEMLDQIGRDIIYNYLLFGRDVTFDSFIDDLKIYLKLIGRTI